MAHASFQETFDAVVALLAKPAYEDRVDAMRRSFQERAGAYESGDPWFEARSRSFLDDALTRQGFAGSVLGELPEAAGVWATALGRAHRGLFVPAGVASGRRWLRDLWGGGEFLVDEVDEACRDALDAAAAPFDGRLAAVTDPLRVALLPGAVFHPAEAAEPLLHLLEVARTRGMEVESALDALLRMELSFRRLSRVKAAYAYREEALR